MFIKGQFECTDKNLIGFVSDDFVEEIVVFFLSFFLEIIKTCCHN